ncbi:unnamed protein product [Cutaneotrichosporon oleaginosum]
MQYCFDSAEKLARRGVKSSSFSRRSGVSCARGSGGKQSGVQGEDRIGVQDGAQQLTKLALGGLERIVVELRSAYAHHLLVLATLATHNVAEVSLGVQRGSAVRVDDGGDAGELLLGDVDVDSGGHGCVGEWVVRYESRV